ncbi:MAG: hypothetical protein E6713_13220 [Sporomusaceae bacterium]|nr:hypothetical protein [Sporomusaceae bacterium]
MGALTEIESFLQDTVIVVADILSLEAVVVDCNLKVIVGTGIYREERGMSVGEGTLSDYCMKLREPLLVVNPRLHDLCRSCARRGRCPDAAEICIPIQVENRVFGTLILLAVNQEQRSLLLGQEVKLIRFGQWLAEIFSQKLLVLQSGSSREPDREKAKPIVSFAELEHQALLAALTRFGVSTAGKLAICQALGISIATFYRKVKEYGINIRDKQYERK